MDEKKNKINKNHLNYMVGLFISLVALVFLFAIARPFAFLNEAIIYVFGFIGYWILIPFLFIYGIYFMFRKKLRKFRFDIALTGVLLILLMILVLTSYWGSDGLSYGEETISNKDGHYVIFNNFMDVYRASFSNGESKYLIFNTITGGGFVGYFFLSLLNTAFTNIGTMIICWVVIFIGFLLILNRQLKALFTYLKSPKEQRKKIKEKKQNIQKSSIEEDSEIEVKGKLLNPNQDDDISLNDDFVFSNQYQNIDPKEAFSYRQDAKDQNISNLTYQQKNHISGMEKAHFVYYRKNKEDTNIISNNILTENSSILPYDNIVKKVEESDGMVNAKPSFISASNNNEVINYGPSNQENIDESHMLDSEENDVYENPFYEDNVATSEIDKIEEAQPEIEETNISPYENEVLVKEEENEVKVKTTINEEIKKENNSEDLSDPLYVPKAKKRPKYTLPSLSLLRNYENAEDLLKNQDSCAMRVEAINKIFSDLNVGAHVHDFTIGPSVTRFNIETAPNVSVSSLNKYINDIASRLGGLNIRFEQVVSGSMYSGLEIPNENRTTVGLKDTLERMDPPNGPSLLVPFGKNISGSIISGALDKFPHMLVAGTTGSGKSIFMHSVIVSLLMRNRPEDLKIVLVDPKKVEMNYYRDIPHLLCPIISEGSEAKVMLDKLVDEMERRYSLFQKYGARDIKSFNKVCEEKELEKIPYIVVFVDEYADLIQGAKDIGQPLVRIGQKARASGIHLVIATQRPETKIITGDIKANLPTRVALMVSNYIDSMTIIGEGGAEKLLGNGDMLIDCAYIARAMHPRVQGCFVEMDEVTRVCEYLRHEMSPQYDKRFLDLKDHSKDSDIGEGVEVMQFSKEYQEEELYAKILEVIMSREYVSISYIQRTFSVGFPKAGRIFNRLMQDGYVSSENDAGRGNKVLKDKIESSHPGSTEQSALIN